jgi:hypothetical protein
MKFDVSGLPIAEADLAHLRIRAPDGSLSLFGDLYCPIGASLVQALELWVHDHPGYSIVLAPKA